jgi:hypothetical protein
VAGAACLVAAGAFYVVDAVSCDLIPCADDAYRLHSL